MKKPASNSAPCPVCNNLSAHWCTTKDWEYFTSEEWFHFYECLHCQLLFIDPLPQNRLQEIYPSHYYSFGEPKKNLAFTIKEYLDKRLFKKILSNIPGNNLHVLDVGGGTGWLLNTIRKTDQRVVYTHIVDINEQCAPIARQNGHHYDNRRIEEFESDKKFDLVIMLNLIEHVASPQQVLSKVGHLLSDKGVILLKTPNYKSWDASLFRQSYWGGLHCPRHWTIFSQQAFYRLTQHLPLHIHQLYYTQGAPFWAYSLLVTCFGKRLTVKKRPLIEHPLFPWLAVFFAAFDFIRGLFVPTSQMFIVLSRKK
jgi:2-polyprenyl-3-methyl-5-hydroxy-6-metoxy-1,4-benzoquinol methylase